MKIAMVSEHANPLAAVGGVDAGGQNVHVAALATALAQHGHQVVVYTRADRPGRPVRVPMTPGVEVEHVSAGPATDVPKDDLLSYMDAFAGQLARSWRADPPDIVHAHFWMSGLAAVQAAAACGSGADTAIPVVQTFHALGTVKRRWQGAADTSPDERIEVELRLTRQVDRIIATCRDEVAELLAMGAADTLIDVVPCGVDTELFRRRPPRSGTRSGQARLVTIGRLVPRKGVDEVIRALALLTDTELLVVGGPGHEELEFDPEVARLRELAGRHRVSDRVTFAGRVDHDRLPSIIAGADLVVAVPVYEPFGIVPLEAMSCGVPVIGSAVGGLLDTVVDGVTGLLVEPGNPPALAAAIAALLSDEDRRAQMGATGAERVRAHFGWDQVALRTEDVYRRTLLGREQHTLTAGAAR